MPATSEDVRPDLRTLKVFEEGDVRFRIYLTVGGAITLDKYDAKIGAWRHVSLCEASESDISDMLAIRYASPDEEIARAVASYRT